MPIEPVKSVKITHAEVRTVPTKHTVYILSVNGQVESWTVSHRYSDFEKLNKSLLTMGQLQYQLPPKIYSLVSDVSRIQERRQNLELYLESILYNKNAVFRRSEEWMDFIAIPEQFRSSIFDSLLNLDSSGKTISPEKWIFEYQNLINSLTEIKQCIIKRNEASSKNDINGYQTFKVNGLKSIRSAKLNYELLSSHLNQETRSLFSKISKSEINRRQDLLGNLKSDLEKLDTDLQNAIYLTTGNYENRRELLDISGNFLLNKSGRKFGVAKETEQTRSLDTQQLIELQTQTIESQNKSLELILGIPSQNLLIIKTLLNDKKKSGMLSVMN